jgi:hypothetical protein
MINYLALLVALSLSSVSAYYSIIGLTAIFAAAFWPVVIMGSVLEVAKVVTASWLYRNWSQTNLVLKTYLSITVAILVFISSMGIFGFLSRAHIEQGVSINTGAADQIAIININIENKKATVVDIDKQIAQIDSAVTKLTDRGQANSSLQAADRQRKTRNDLVSQKSKLLSEISELNTQKVKLSSGIKKLEAEVGPIKYIAELLYGDKDSGNVERAIRGVILVLVIVFDPLAILLLIAANQSLTKRKDLPIIHTNDTIESDKVLRIDDIQIWR